MFNYLIISFNITINFNFIIRLVKYFMIVPIQILHFLNFLHSIHNILVIPILIDLFIIIIIVIIIIIIDYVAIIN
jgi:hypothetical protein